MKLTKGMKKALSLLLSAAMVVTGVNVTTGTASADEKTLTVAEAQAALEDAKAAQKSAEKTYNASKAALDAVVDACATASEAVITAQSTLDTTAEKFASILGDSAEVANIVELNKKESFDAVVGILGKVGDDEWAVQNWLNGHDGFDEEDSVYMLKMSADSTEYTFELKVTDKTVNPYFVPVRVADILVASTKSKTGLISKAKVPSLVTKATVQFDGGEVITIPDESKGYTLSGAEYNYDACEPTSNAALSTNLWMDAWGTQVNDAIITDFTSKMTVTVTIKNIDEYVAEVTDAAVEALKTAGTIDSSAAEKYDEQKESVNASLATARKALRDAVANAEAAQEAYKENYATLKADADAAKTALDNADAALEAAKEAYDAASKAAISASKPGSEGAVTAAPTVAPTDAVSGGATAAPTVAPTDAVSGGATEAPTAAPADTKEPVATEKPVVEPLADQDTAFLMFTDGSWGWGNWSSKVNGGFGNDAVITGNGDYSVSIDADGYAASQEIDTSEVAAADGATVFCVDFKGLSNSPNLDVSGMKVSNLKIYADNKSINVNTAKVLMGDIEDNGNFRIEIYNAYGDTNEDPAIDADELTFSKSLKVSFTLSGIKEGTSDGAFTLDSTDAGKTYVSLDDAVDELTGAGEDDPEPIVLESEKATAEPATAAPATTAAVTTGTATVAPASNAAVTTSEAVKGTSKLTVAKSLVVVAPGKSTTVKFTAKKAAGASSAAVVKVSSKSKKVAKVAKKGSKVKITVPKKAVKGASTTVTLKSTKLNGKAISAKVKVYVRNTAKKVKPAKKSITVKKNKTVKLVLNASGKIQNKKKPVAETVTVQGKVVKLTAVKYAKKKITVTLKGVKKAKNKAVTIKVGTKKVKVKATVK
jgi:hypothetical protein